jgi:hypothetical protein
LAQPGRRLTGLIIEADQTPLSRFVQRVQSDPTASLGNSRLEAACGAEAGHQSFQQPGQLLAQSFTLKELPMIKLGAVGQAKTGQKVVGIEAGCLGEQG